MRAVEMHSAYRIDPDTESTTKCCGLKFEALCVIICNKCHYVIFWIIMTRSCSVEIYDSTSVSDLVGKVVRTARKSVEYAGSDR
jgi:hypothetical protein